MTHPGVGPLTALAFMLIIGTPGRFRRGKQIGSYTRLIPSEDSSGGRQRLGTSANKAMPYCVFCWWKRRKPRHGVIRTGGKDIGIWRCVGKRALPKVALGRQMAVRLYWMWCKGWDYAQLVEFGSHTGQLDTGRGVH
jgi:transposase